MVDRVTERSDGVTDERITEHSGGTTIIERRGGSGAGLLIGLAILILAAIAAVYFYNESRNDAIKTDAISEAADAVGDGAKKVGDAASKAGDAVTDEAKK